MCALVQVAIREPVGDHDIALILGTSWEGRLLVEGDSEKRVGLRGFRAVGRTSFLRGFERRGGAMVGEGRKKERGAMR